MSQSSSIVKEKRKQIDVPKQLYIVRAIPILSIFGSRRGD